MFAIYARHAGLACRERRVVLAATGGGEGDYARRLDGFGTDSV